MSSILLVGGTVETHAIAQALAGAGHAVLVCTATDMPLPIGDSPAIRRHCGRLTAGEFEALMCAERIDVVVNAAHPYAVGVRAATREAAARLGLVHVEFLRPEASAAPPEAGVRYADDHPAAARLAMAAGQRILLTIGVNHIGPYAEAACAGGRDLVVRVLARAESLAACRAAGLRDDQVIQSRGVCTVEENVAAIRLHGIQVLVTKDSGIEGGVPEKLEAARQTGCVVVLVRRPPPEVETATSARTVPDLVALVRRRLAWRAE